jgi:high-affinity Fe2+/Pb2+ permease
LISPRPKFIPRLPAREWLAILLGGACLGLLLAWLQKKFCLNAQVVQAFLLVTAGLLLLWCVLLMIVYVKELRRAEDEWADYDDQDADDPDGKTSKL